ncbi:39S ribosomal protein L10, mitochondrial-like [Mya arenaria]|uniref:39S ribosomal protein L10, mitochondrial-like n=1 Tax=Mya arenaria TaxID=6604 RepID=UPI0022DF5BE5|nr:39S ribosomal protein L10, mitochondrial-like [Mya arenaria]
MAAFLCRICQTRKWVNPVLITQVRYKFKTQRPKQQIMEKRIFEEIMAPLYDKERIPYKSCADLQRRRMEEEQVHDQPENILQTKYEAFLLRRLQVLIDNSKMMLICQRPSAPSYRVHDIRIDLKLAGFTFQILSNKHMKQLTQGTKLENLAPLLTSNNILITSPNVAIHEFMKATKKMPEIILLGGFVGDRLVTKDQMVEFNNLPNIDQLQGQLYASLNQVGGARTLSLLSSHQQQLTSNLQQYHKQKSEDSDV